MWRLSFPARYTTSVSCIGRWILHDWTTREASSGLLLVLGFLRNLLGLCSNIFPWTGRPKSFWYLSDLLLFLLCLSWKNVGWAVSSWIECGRCFWIWARPVCLLRAAFVVEVVVMSCYLGLPLSCYHQQGLFTCVVLTMLVSVPWLPRCRGLYEVLQTLQVGHICLSKVVSLQLPQ